jgi:hypothetical protein
MRAEAHARLEAILDQKEEWSYPMVATVIVEAPAVRAVLAARRKKPSDE